MYLNLILCQYLQMKRIDMNRRQKDLKILKARIKKANAKLAPPKKSKYICKADREKLALESSQEQTLDQK